MRVVRLRIHADLNDRRPDDSVDVRLDAELTDGTSVALLADRGWTSGGQGIASLTAPEAEQTAATVVGPDEPYFAGETEDAMHRRHWATLEQKLRDAGVTVDPGQLDGLPRTVELSSALRRMLKA